MLVSPEQVKQYHKEGYCVLESVIPAEHVANLRAECGRFIEAMHAEMDAQGTDVLGINHRHKRYFVSRRGTQSEKLARFLYSDVMAEVTQALLGENVYLFNEQYVVKSAEVGMKFAWHQDSGYVHFRNGAPHKPYLSCWCPLDDVTIENGTVYILPFDRAGTREIVPHLEEEGTNDKVGYFGDDPGDPVIVPAGSIVAFTSYTFHRSGPNTTNQARRVYLAQYSSEPIRTQDGAIWGWAYPVVQNGQRLSPDVLQ
ncbi:MAG: phytanoyl-CoA dioxygenase family protein [Caldilineaceae bacterium]